MMTDIIVSKQPGMERERPMSVRIVVAFCEQKDIVCNKYWWMKYSAMFMIWKDFPH